MQPSSLDTLDDYVLREEDAFEQLSIAFLFFVISMPFSTDEMKLTESLSLFTLSNNQPST